MNRRAPSGDQIVVGVSRIQQSARVRLYTVPGCAACGVARRLLRRRGIEFDEVQGEATPSFRRALQEETGRMTVPQVVIDDEPIGGADALLALDRIGVLLPRVRHERFPVVTVRRRLSLRRHRRYEVLLSDRDGRVLERGNARSAEEAEGLAEALRAEHLA